MNRLAHQTMKYTMLALICIFFILCAGLIKHIVEVALPSDDSVRVASLSTDLFAAQQHVQACSLSEHGDLFEDMDDAIILIENMDFFLWSGVVQQGLGVCSPIVWRPLPKIPIA